MEFLLFLAISLLLLSLSSFLLYTCEYRYLGIFSLTVYLGRSCECPVVVVFMEVLRIKK